MREAVEEVERVKEVKGVKGVRKVERVEVRKGRKFGGGWQDFSQFDGVRILSELTICKAKLFRIALPLSICL